MLLCFVPATASAAVTITTVVDTSTTPLAGAPGSSAVIRNGHVAFMAHSPPGALYTWFSGTLGVAVDTTTAVPGGPGNFQSGDFLHQATVDGNGATALTIEPHTTTPAGVYDTASGSLQVTDQQFAQYPVGGWWEGARIDDGKVAFIARTASGVTGIHTNIGGAMQTIVDTNTLIPGTSLFFTGFRPPEISGQHVAFVGYSSSFQGVFLWDPVAGLTAVATTNTLLTECPTAGDTFIGFGTGVDADDGAVVFYGQGCRPTERIQGVFKTHAAPSRPLSSMERRLREDRAHCF
jgi:hypothetical protein